MRLLAHLGSNGLTTRSIRVTILFEVTMTMPHAKLEYPQLESGDMSDTAGASPELFYLDPSWLPVDPSKLGGVVTASTSAGP